MGASPSKGASDSQQHVFAADAPVRFSEGLINSLQENPETDSTRAKNLELLIQSRVTSELEKMLAESSKNLASQSDSVSQEPFTPKKEPDHPLLGRLAEKITGSDDSGKSRFDPNLDRSTVAKEVEELRKKLQARKQLVQTDKEVEKAKQAVVICLRKNDRRPLDCWQEVEKFKTEVGRLERAFVDKNAS